MARHETTPIKDPDDGTAVILAPTKQRSLWSDAAKRLVRNRLSLVGLAIFLALFIVAIFGPMLAPYPYMLQDLDNVAKPPSLQHLLGTDDLGRDFFSRILWGARTAAIVAIMATFSSLTLGVLMGSIAAYAGGWVDWGVSRAIDITMSIPDLLFASLVAATVREPVSSFVEHMYAQTHWGFFKTATYMDLIVVFGALAVVNWPGYARLIRGQILTLREKEFVEAGRCIGLTGRQLLLRYLIPNALGPIVVAMTFGFGGAIIAESGLSYLGIGVQPPQASWGAMINDNAASWRFRPLLTIIPGIVVGIVSLGINFLGDGLNDALNPRSAKRR